MNRRDLITFLGLQVFAIVWAGVVFSQIESRLIAGALAGGYFVLSAAYMLQRALKWRDRWRSTMIYPLGLHLFGISLPMIVTRFMQAQLNFEDIQIWGLPAPLFHQLSTWIFAALMAATVTDLIRLGLRDRNPKANN
jgi:hypothetical protein